MPARTKADSRQALRDLLLGSQRSRAVDPSLLRERILSWRAVRPTVGEGLLDAQVLGAIVRYLNLDDGVIATKDGHQRAEASILSLDESLAEIVTLSSFEKPILLTVGELKRAGEGSVGFLKALSRTIFEASAPVLLVISYMMTDDLELEASFVFDAVEDIKAFAESAWEEKISSPSGMKSLLGCFRGLRLSMTRSRWPLPRSPVETLFTLRSLFSCFGKRVS